MTKECYYSWYSKGCIISFLFYSTSYAELDLSIHSTTVKCEPDTTNKDTKVNEPPRSPYLDYHHPFTSYNDNNNDLQTKMDTLQQYNQYGWNQYSDVYQHTAAGIGDLRYKVNVLRGHIQTT